MLTFIYEFDELDKALINVTDENAVMYQYLSWLGLSHREILEAETGDYNTRMRMLHTGGRVVYIKEDKIAAALETAAESDEFKIIPDADAAKKQRKKAV